MKKLLLLAVFAIGGCATAVPEAELAAADCGPKPDSLEYVKAKLARELFDPDSIKALAVTEPRRCNQRTASYRPVFGWCFSYEYNAKNRYGGYVGLQHHEIMVRDGKDFWLDGMFIEPHF